MMEVLQLAQPAKVNLEQKDIDDWYAVLNGLSPQGKTSMLQDVEAGRKTEIEIFGGKVLELGNQFHISTPVNQTVVSIIKVMEGQAG